MEASQVAQWLKIHLPMQKMREIGFDPLGWGDSPRVANGNPLYYSCLKNSMYRRAWGATFHGVTELDTTERLSTHTQYI